ncbi:MAG: hypothetical protein AAF950_07150 [Pseudomonadota bacterium]
MSEYAVNPQTGQVLKRDGQGGWTKVQSARNAGGEVLINEGAGWTSIPGRSSQASASTSNLGLSATPQAGPDQNRVRQFAQQLQADGFASNWSDDELMTRAQEIARQNPTGRIRTAPASSIDAPPNELRGPVESSQKNIGPGWGGRAQAASISAIDTVNQFPGAGHVMRGIVGGVNTALGGDETTLAPINETFDAAKLEAVETHPNSSSVGDLAAFASGPGQIIYQGGAKVGAPIMAQVSKRVSGSGVPARLARYATRLAGLGAVGAAEVAGSDATQGARNEALLTGQEPTLERGLELGKEALQNPLNYAGLPMISLLYRTLRAPASKVSGLFTGTGSSVTPRNVQRQIERATGGAVPSNASMNQAAGDLNAGMFGEDMTRRAVKDYGHLMQALQNADVPPDRIITGFNRIANSGIEPGSRDDLTRLLEREFASEYPGVVRNLREFLLKVGIEGKPGIQQTLRGRSDILRQSQANELRTSAQTELGSQPRIQAGDELNDQLRTKGAEYDRLLAAAPRNSQYADEAAELALRAPELSDALAAQARNAGVDVETLVRRNPFAALHWVQSQITDPSLGPTRRSMQDLLERGVPGYKQLRNEYHRIATARDALGYFDQQTGQYVPGIGDRLAGRGNSLTGAAKNELGADHLAREYTKLAEFDDQAAKAADLSFRDVVTDPLRGTRTTGLDNYGQDVAGARLGAMQTEGVTDSLTQILGQRGQRLSDTIRRIVDERQYLADIGSGTGSNTVNKAQASTNGAQPMSHGLGRLTTDAGSAALLDGALMMTGNVPIVTALRWGAPGLARRFQPRPNTQARIAERMTRPLNEAAPSASEMDIARLLMRPNANRRNYVESIADLLTSSQVGSPPRTRSRGRESEAGSIDPRLLGLNAQNDLLSSATENPSRTQIGRMMGQQKRQGSLPIVRLIQTEDGRVLAFDGTRYTHADFANSLGVDFGTVGRAVVQNTPDQPRNLQWFDANDQPWQFHSRTQEPTRAAAFNDPRLSAQENRIVEMRRNGFTNQDIADLDDTSPETVKVALSKARRKAPDIEIPRMQVGQRGTLLPIVRELSEQYPDLNATQIAERASARLGRTVTRDNVYVAQSRLRHGRTEGLEEGFVDPDILRVGANMIMRGPVSGGVQGGMIGAMVPANDSEQLKQNIFTGMTVGAFGGSARSHHRNGGRRTQTGIITNRGNGAREGTRARRQVGQAGKPSQRDRAIELRSAGMTDQQIASELSLSLDQVNNLLLGVPRPKIRRVGG